MDYSEKHVIVGKSNHVFTNLYIDVLVTGCGLQSSRFVFLTLDDEDNFTLPAYIKIPIVSYNKADVEAISLSSSITFLSFTIFNSYVCRDLYDLDSSTIERMYVFLTDDEVARWKKSIKRFGQIMPCEELRIGEDDIYMLPFIKNFITNGGAFRRPLEKILRRSDFNIIEARDPFSTMPVVHTKLFGEILAQNTVHDVQENKILLGSKRGCFNLVEVIAFINGLLVSRISNKYKIILFVDPSNKIQRIIIDMYCIFIKFFAKSIIDISYYSRTNSLVYTCIIMSCSHFVLQGRGGVSSARTYLRANRGLVCVKKGTPNALELEHGLNLGVIKYDSLFTLGKSLERFSISVETNTEVMKKDLSTSYRNLTQIYYR